MEVYITRINSRVDAANLLERPLAPAKSQMLGENFRLIKRNSLNTKKIKYNLQIEIKSRTKKQLHTLLPLLSKKRNNSNFIQNRVQTAPL